MVQDSWICIVMFKSLIDSSVGQADRESDCSDPEREDLFARKCSSKSSVDASEVDMEKGTSSRSKRIRKKPSKYSIYNMY